MDMKINSMLEKIYKENKAKPTETIYEHTQLLLDNFKLLKEYGYLSEEINDIEEILYLSCLYHDIGKINPYFQKRLNSKRKFNDKEEVGHNILSAYLVNFFVEEDKDNKEKLMLIRNSILNHHYYVENFTFIDGETNTKLIEKNLIGINNKYFKEKENDFILRVKRTGKAKIVDRMKNKIKTKEYIIIKGLLNKCDYSASAHIICEKKNDFLLKALEDLNYNWRDIQNFCIENRKENLIIVGSTGLGKTEASLLWAGDNKIFYVLPLKTAINAMYDRIKEIVGDDYDDKVALLHGQTDSVYLNDMEDGEGNIEKEKFFKYYKSTKNLSMPITVATPDQLFDVVFKYNGYELKMATFSYSYVIVDEIQAYSPDILAYTIYAIRKINDLGGKVAIFTATLAPFVKDLLVKKINGSEFKYKEGTFLTENIRHSMKVCEKRISSEYIEEKLKERQDIKSCLIVMNTVKGAQELYYNLKNSLDDEIYEVKLLHSKFTVEDRAKKEEEILNDGDLSKRSGKIKVWVATQIVEASLDIDFDIMFTELSELLGLFQRLGRVFRKRILNSEEFNVYVFTELYHGEIDNGDKGFIDRELYELSKIALLEKGNGYISENDKLEMINEYFTTEKLKESKYYKAVEIKYDYIDSLKIGQKDIDDVKKEFRNIISFKAIPFGIYSTPEVTGLIRDVDLCYEQMIALEGEDRNNKRIELLKLQDNLNKKTLSVNSWDVNFNSQIEVAKERLYLTNTFYNSELGLVNKGMVEKLNLVEKDEVDRWMF